MNEYAPKWRAPLDHGWETETHFYPSFVELEAEGKKGAPDVSVRFEMRDGVPDVVDFRITAKENGRAVRTADLNAWQPLEGLATNAFRRWARLKDPSEDPNTSNPYGPRHEADAWKIRGDLETARGLNRGPSPAELEEVARVYRDAIDGRPTEAVQTMLGYSRRTAARRVQQARAAGLLPATSPGKKNA